MIDAANTNVRQIITPDGIKTLVQFVYVNGLVINLHAAGGGKLEIYAVEDCEEITGAEKRKLNG